MNGRRTLRAAGITASAAAMAAATLVAVAFRPAPARADVVVETDWNVLPPTGDGWDRRYGGFTDYADGQTPPDQPQGPGGISQVNVNGDTKLKYVNYNGQYWGQLVGQSWANPNISVPNMQANPIVEFDLDLSGANWGQLSLKVDVENKATSAGDQVGTHSYDFSQLAVKNRGTNPITQHISLDLSQLSTPIGSMLTDGTGDQNLLLYFQPGYYGYWDNNLSAWVDGYVNQTYVIDNLRFTTGAAKINAAVNTSGGGNWSDGSIWAGGGGVAPNGAGHTANFGSTDSGGNSIASQTVNVDAPVTLGVLNFYNGNSQTISGSNAITLTGTAGVAPAINVAMGNHTVSAPVILTGNTTVTVSQAANTLTLANLTAGSGVTLSKAGAGTLAVNHVRADGLAITGGTVRVAATGGVAAGTSKLATLNIAAGGKLDINDNKLIVTGANAVGSWNGSAYTGVTGQIASGYSPNQDFSGSGIVTSQSSASGGNTLTNIGVANNADIGLSTFGGVSVGAGDALVMYTWNGDANLDGVVNGDDYFQIDSAFPQGLSGWANGDFNYDGVVNGDDYFVIDSTFPQQGAAFPVSGGIAGVAAVPEPASLGLLGLGLGAALSRRRRGASRIARIGT